jgi:hypothetical protein
MAIWHILRRATWYTYFMAIWYILGAIGIFFIQPLGIFMAIWYILWPFGIFYGHLVHTVGNLVCSPHFGKLYKE